MSLVIDQDDAALVDGTKNGNDACFAELVRRYEGTVAATVISMLGPGDEADEVGQEVMIKFYRSLARFDGQSTVKTYLTRIAINSAKDALRRRKRNRLRFFTPKDNEDAWEDKIAGLEDQGRDVENTNLVSFALSKLHPDIRAVVVLRLVEGWSTQEAANILQVPTGTILSRLSRGKIQMAKAISGASA